MNPALGRRAHIVVLAQALREAEPHRQQADRRRGDVAVDERRGPVGLPVVAAERLLRGPDGPAREVESAPQPVEQDLHHGSQDVCHVRVHEAHLAAGRGDDAADLAPHVPPSRPGHDQLCYCIHHEEDGDKGHVRLLANPGGEPGGEAAGVGSFVVDEHGRQEDNRLSGRFVEDVPRCRKRLAGPLRRLVVEEKLGVDAVHRPDV
mmetsp:Transcript_30345/g.102391  ORF Transcript_30345/g.102391 Transcript_30345/m.102391 type:complete len:205 (+) Transcript_30345:633-1247(+)